MSGSSRDEIHAASPMIPSPLPSACCILEAEADSTCHGLQQYSCAEAKAMQARSCLAESNSKAWMACTFCVTVMQESMPNSLHTARSGSPVNGCDGSPVSGSHAASAAVSEPAQSGQGGRHTGLEMAPNEAGRMASASSSDSDPNREGPLPFLQAAVPNLPASEHALNDLDELHSRAGAAVSSPSVSRTASGRRLPPSRASSWGSSRAGSALLRTNSKLASMADAETEQLALHGMSII